MLCNITYGGLLENMIFKSLFLGHFLFWQKFGSRNHRHILFYKRWDQSIYRLELI